MNIRFTLLITPFLLTSLTMGVFAQQVTPGSPAVDPAPEQAEEEIILVTLDTTRGPIHLKLYPEKAPMTVANFVNLAQRKYYDGLTFHRVIPNFMIQGGCPQGSGRGGPGYRFQDEVLTDLKHDKAGVLSMANAGPGTNGSQFFITHLPTPHLNGRHTVFGEVVDEKDQAIVNKIQKGDKIKTVTVDNDASNLRARQERQIAQWNAILDRQFPELPKYPAAQPAAPSEAPADVAPSSDPLPTSPADN